MVAEEADAVLRAEQLTARNDQLQTQLEAEEETGYEEEPEPLRTGLDGLYGGANPYDPDDELPTPNQIRGLTFAQRDALEKSSPGLIAQCQAKWQWELAKQEEGG